MNLVFPQDITSVALHPPSGWLCYAAVMVGGKNQAEVHCAWMDGRKKSVLWRKCSLPGSLSFSSEGRVVYWADTGEQSAALRGGLATFVLTVCVPLQLKV